MDSFNLIKYVYRQSQNDNTEIDGKWFLFGDVLKDNVWPFFFFCLLQRNFFLNGFYTNILSFFQFIWSVSVLTIITIAIYGWYYWRQWVIRGKKMSTKNDIFFQNLFIEKNNKNTLNHNIHSNAHTCNE